MTNSTSHDHDFTPLATLAALQDVTPAQMPLLEILTNPANDPYQAYSSRAAMFEDLTEMASYKTAGGYEDAALVADRIREYVRRTGREGGPGDLHFGFDSNSEGEIQAFRCGVHLGYPVGALVRAEGTKHLTTDREATGLHAALGYATAIHAAYQRMHDQARTLGLLPHTMPASAPVAAITVADLDEAPDGGALDDQALARIDGLDAAAKRDALNEAFAPHRKTFGMLRSQVVSDALWILDDRAHG